MGEFYIPALVCWCWISRVFAGRS